MEYGWFAALYARFGAANPILSYVVIGLLGALVADGLWWVTAQQYQQQEAERRERSRPAVEVPAAVVTDLQDRLRESEGHVNTLRTELSTLQQTATADRQAKEKAEQLLRQQSEQKRKVQERLAALADEGFAIKAEWNSRLGQGAEAQQASAARVVEWQNKTAAYLKESLGESYVVRFRSLTRSAGVPEGLNVNIGGRYQDLDAALNRLAEFLQELR